MTMADPRAPLPEQMYLDLRLLLTEADPDDDLSCWLCHRQDVEWQVTLKLDGRTIGVGIHERCRLALVRRMPKPPGA